MINTNILALAVRQSSSGLIKPEEFRGIQRGYTQRGGHRKSAEWRNNKGGVVADVSRSADQPAEGALQSQQTVAERNLIPAINEPLCFLTNKMDTMPADILMKLCHDFYDDDQIDGAKQLLHEVCMQMGNSLPRLIKRRGAQKKENDINDIMQVLLEIDTGHVPVFLAKDLKNLPPLSYNHFDITKVMADIELLKNEMGIARFIAQSHKDIMDAIKDLKQSDGNCDITGNDHIYTRTDETRLNAAVAPVRMNDVAGTDEVDSDNSITAVKQYCRAMTIESKSNFYTN